MFTFPTSPIMMLACSFPPSYPLSPFSLIDPHPVTFVIWVDDIHMKKKKKKKKNAGVKDKLESFIIKKKFYSFKKNHGYYLCRDPELNWGINRSRFTVVILF